MFEIPAAIPAEIAERQHDRGRVYDAADRLADARENIKSRLMRGKAIGHKTIEGAYEVGVGEEMKEREIIAILCNLACAEDNDQRIECQERAVKLLDAYIDSMGDEIEAESIAIQTSDDFDVARIARHCGAI
jgi:hypothetical protein